MYKALLALNLLACAPDKGETPPNASEKQELQEATIEQITLGNVDFIFEANSGFTEQEKTLLKNHMEAAHAKLSKSLGEKVMKFPKQTKVKVHKIGTQEARGRVQLGNTDVKFTKELKPKLQGDSLGEIGLFIGEISEPNIAHEFTHLFAQSSYFWSEAFYEGLVYGLINHLYPEYYSSLPDFHLALVRQKCVATLFEKGWDYDQADIAVGKGINDRVLKKLLHSEWAIMWADFITEHPEFPKRFFSLVLEEREKGKLDFSRDELQEIAQHAEPDFGKWLAQKGSSAMPIEGQDAFYMVETGKDQFSIFNFTATPTETSSGKLHAGHMEQARKGSSVIVSPGHPGGPIPTTAFGKIDAPGISRMPSYSVVVNGTTVPFLDSTTCEEKTN